MALYFDESFYLQTKLKQLEATGSKDANGQAWTENSLRKAMTDIGLTPEQHYESFGRVEKVNPNAYFNESEYLSAKLKALQEDPATASEWAGKGVNELVKVMESLNLTPAQHYERFGAFETRGDGTLLNPSNAFDANAYFAAKLLQMQVKGETLNGKPAAQATVADVVAAFKAAGISPTTHYESFGAKEANAQGVALVQTVPSEQRVANDGFRGALGQNVPTNYNPASKAPADATASAVAKPADVGGLASSSISPTVTPPASAAPVPGDSNYVKPPAGLVDTNANPVIAPTTKGDGSTATDCWATSNGDGTADLIRPDGESGGTITLDPNNPSVIPPSTPTPTPPPSDPVNPPVTEVTFTSSVTAGTLTFGGTATGDVTMTMSDAHTATFTRGGKTVTVDLTKAGSVVSVIDIPTDKISITAAVADALSALNAGAGAKFASTDAVTVTGIASANETAALTAYTKAELGGSSVTLTATDGNWSVTASALDTALAAGVKLAGDVTVTGVTAGSAALTAYTAAKVGATKVVLDATSNAWSVSMSELDAALGAKISFAASDTVTVTGITNSSETAALSKYTTATVGAKVVLDADDNSWSLTAAQVDTAIAAGIKFAGGDTLIITGIAPGNETAALTAYTQTLVGGAKIILDATDDTWALTFAEYTAATTAEITFAAADEVTLTAALTDSLTTLVNVDKLTLGSDPWGTAAVGTSGDVDAAGEWHFNSSNGTLTYWDG